MAWVDYVVAHPIRIILLSLLANSLFALGIPGFEIKNSPRDHLGKDIPLVKHLIELEEEYIEDKNVFFMLKPKTGDIFDRQFLQSLKDFTDDAWQIPHARRVDALTNFQYSHADGNDLIVEDLVEDVSTLSDQDIEAIRQVALSDPRLAGLLVSTDGKAAGVNVPMTHELGDLSLRGDIFSAIEQLKDQTISLNPNLDIYETGYVFMTEHWLRGAISDVTKIFSLSVTLIFVGLIFFFGNLRAAIAVLFVGLLAAATGLGVLGYFGVGLTPPTALSVLMILVLGLADGIHVTKSMRRLLAEGVNYKEAIAQSVVSNFMPIALTSITTAIGFISFNLSGYAGIEAMGNFVAFGVMMAFVLSVSLLPALLCYCGVPPEKNQSRKNLSTMLADIVINRHNFFLFLTVPTVIISIYCMFLNEFDERVSRYMKEDNEFTVHLDQIQSDLTGLSAAMYSFSAGETDGISDPEYLSRIDAFASWLRRRPDVRHVSSFSDTVKQLNKSLNRDEDIYYQIPESKELAAQYILLYELSLPFGLDLTNQINLDKSATRVIVTADDMSTNELVAFLDELRIWLEENAPDFEIKPNGNMLSSSLLVKETTLLMISSGIGALVIIALVLMFTFRSFHIGLICAISVLSPIIVTYGLWGIVVGNIGLPGALAVCMVIGISVDFSVHFISKFVRAQRLHQMNKEDSVCYAFREVASAIITSVAVIGGGFWVLGLSSFEYNSVMGNLTAICILFAALSAFLLVPSILLRKPEPAQ